MDLLQQIQSLFDTYTNNEKKIAQFIIKDPKYFARTNIETAIENIGISKAALIRFSKKLGFNGYTELKYELNRYLLSNNVKLENNEDNHPISNITNRYIEAIDDMVNCLDIHKIDLAAKSLLESHHITICGLNKSGASLDQFAKRLLNLNIHVSTAKDDTQIIFDYLNTLTSQDTLVIFTVEDTTKFYSKNITSFKESQCNIIVVTFDKNTLIVKNANHSFVLPKLSKQYATFLDVQALFFIFIEIFVTELAKIKKSLD